MPSISPAAVVKNATKFPQHMAKILIVDDDEDIVALLGFNLDAKGYTVITAFTANEALTKAREHLPDLIILDVLLPDLDGITVCEILQRENSTRDIPIIMHTAVGGEIARLVALDAGAEDYARKPFSPRDLMNLVAVVLQRYGPQSRTEKSRLAEREYGSDQSPLGE
jgi:DNA-binding response OmpR family regulator